MRKNFHYVSLGFVIALAVVGLFLIVKAQIEARAQAEAQAAAGLKAQLDEKERLEKEEARIEHLCYESWVKAIESQSEADVTSASQFCWENDVIWYTPSFSSSGVDWEYRILEGSDKEWKKIYLVTIYRDSHVIIEDGDYVEYNNDFVTLGLPAFAYEEGFEPKAQAIDESDSEPEVIVIYRDRPLICYPYNLFGGANPGDPNYDPRCD